MEKLGHDDNWWYHLRNSFYLSSRMIELIINKKLLKFDKN